MVQNPFTPCVPRPAELVLLLVVVLLTTAPSSAQVKGQGKAKQPDFIPAGYDDYQNMLDQLGIKKNAQGTRFESQGHFG